MTKHPYEFGGILFTIAVLGGILGGVAFDNLEYDKSSSSGSSSNCSLQGEKDLGNPCSVLEKYMPMFPKPVYDNHIVDEMQECKKVAKDLQEFYDCVNG